MDTDLNIYPKVPIKLEDGTVFYIETNPISTREDVAWNIFEFKAIKNQIVSISKALVEPLKEVAPSKITLEFGIDIGVESGELTSLLVKGTGNANIKISLEWTPK